MSLPSDDLAHLIGARICHDLVSPIGAISNGLELLAMMSETGPSEEMALVEDSARAATARIQLFRLAVGTCDPAARMRFADLATIFDGAFAGGRLSVHWTGPDELPRTEAQAGALAVLCVESVLPRGGDIRATFDGTAGWQVGTEATPRRETDLWTLVAAPGTGADHMRPAEVQFGLLAAFVARSNRTARVEDGPERLVLTF